MRPTSRVMPIRSGRRATTSLEAESQNGTKAIGSHSGEEF